MPLVLMALGAIIPAYVIGSVNGALITSKMLYRKDIRDYGSGNAGLTNFYRVFGAGGALLVVLIDTLKTLLPVFLGGFIFARFMPADSLAAFPFTYISSPVFFGRALAGLAVIFGHCFPVFYKFRGGKGVMAIGCVVLVLDWRIGLIAWGVFILVVLLTRYVSMGSIIGSASFPVTMIIFDYFGIGNAGNTGNADIAGAAETAVAALCVLLVVVRHAKNIERIFKGEESKFSFKKKETAEAK